MRPVHPTSCAPRSSVLVAAFAGAMPVQASQADKPPGKNCVGEAEDARARAAGDSGGEEEGAPPKLSRPFYKRAVTLDVSADGMDGQELPVSIEEVCDIPKSWREGRSAARRRRRGRAAAAPHNRLAGPHRPQRDRGQHRDRGADTALVRGRLARPSAWRPGRGRQPVATFRTRRIEVTD